jgi:hypothetical protein
VLEPSISGLVFSVKLQSSGRRVECVRYHRTTWPAMTVSGVSPVPALWLLVGRAASDPFVPEDLPRR